MKKAMIFLATILLTQPLAAQHQNKAVLSTADGEQQLNTSEIQCIRFDGGRVTVVQPWGTTVFDRTLRELTFLRPLPGTVRLTVDATIGNDADQVSRRALSLGGDGKVRSTWEAGDRVYVYADSMSTESLGTLTPETTGAATARLVGDISVDGLTPGQTLYLSTMSRPHTFAAQTGRLEDIFFATATSALTKVEGNASLANTTFANAQAITRFTMKDGYNNDVSISRLVITGGAGTITVTPTAATTTVYVALPATTAQTTYSFTATTSDSKTRTGTKTANVQQGSYYRTNVTVKLTASVSAAPTPKNWLTYNGSTQQLVNAGTTVGGTMKYAVTTTGSQPASGYSSSIPTGIDYGTYYVWYYVEGDSDHHSNSVAGPVTCSIGKAELVIEGVSHAGAFSGVTGYPRTSYMNGDQAGLYVVDSEGIVKAANVKCTYSGTKFLPESTVYIENGCSYYLYSPYKPTVSGGHAVGDNVGTNVSANTFFSGIIGKWRTYGDQSATNGSGIASYDLQVTRLTGTAVTYTGAMERKVGLAVFTLGTSSKTVKEYQPYHLKGYEAYKFSAYVRDIVSECTASADFRTDTKPYKYGSQYMFVVPIGKTYTIGAGGDDFWNKGVYCTQDGEVYSFIANSSRSRVDKQTELEWELQVGDVFHADGMLHRQGSCVDGCPPRDGCVAYVGNDDYTERLYGGGHALVILTPTSSRNYTMVGGNDYIDMSNVFGANPTAAQQTFINAVGLSASNISSSKSFDSAPISGYVASQ